MNRTAVVRYLPFTILSLLVFWSFGKWVLIPNTWDDSDTFWHLRTGMEMISNGRVLYEAINTFQERLPYIPHEAGFQFILAALYLWGGWHSVHLLTFCSLCFLIWGLYRLACISRRESGLPGFHPLLHILIVVVIILVYSLYFKIRPQLISTPAVLWFFIWMRKYQVSGRRSAAVVMLVLALFISNVHGAIFPVLVVFWAFALAESLSIRSVSRRHFVLTGLLILTGICNADPLHAVFYISGTKNFSNYISEWQAVEFRKYPMLALMLFVYVWGLWSSKEKTLFRIMFGVGILFLGVVTYKTFLYLLLFLVYEAAASVETIPYINRIRYKLIIDKRHIFVLFTAILSLTLIRGFMTPYAVNKEVYPVDEMDYIIQSAKDAPKVLASYAVSGYVMYRDGRVLCDGRYDPFVTDVSRGIRNRTAFERSFYAFQTSDDLLEVIKAEQPDYLLLANQNPPSAARERILRELGQPVYQGTYGIVYRFSH